MATLHIGLYPGINRNVQACSIADEFKAKGFEVVIVGISEENDLDISINGVMFHSGEAKGWIETLLSSIGPTISVPGKIHDDISALWKEPLDDVDGDMGG